MSEKKKLQTEGEDNCQGAGSFVGIAIQIWIRTILDLP